MSTQIGEVNINLRLSLAQFKTDVQEGSGAASEATKKMASEIGESSQEAKGSLMLISHELHLGIPRHLTALIAQIPGLSEAFATMLPVVGVLTAIAVVEKLWAAHEKAKEAMLLAMDEIGAKDATVLGDLTNKLDGAKLKFLELTDDGVGVAQIKLEMLAHKTLAELVGAFDNLGKSLDDVFKKMGAEGTFAKLMGLTGASEDLKALQHDVLAIRASDESDTQKAEDIGKKIEFYKDKAKADLDKMKADRDQLNTSDDGALMAGGGHSTDKQITEQQNLYANLSDMAKANAIVKQTADMDSTNTSIEEANKATKEEEKQWLARNVEYQRALKSDEQEEAAHYKDAVANIQEAEKLKIDATRQGSQARLDAVIAALKDEEAHGLQDTAFYRSLEEEKLKIAEQMANERILLERKLAIELGKAEQGRIALSMAGMKEQADFELKTNIINVQEHIAALRIQAEQTLALEKQKNADVLAEMSANDPLYPVALQKRLDADLQAQQKYDNEIVALDHQAIELRKQAWDAGFNQMNSGMSTLVGNMLKGNGSITADLKTMLQNMLASWIDYFVQLEAKALEAKLFMAATGLFGGGGFGGGLFSSLGGGSGAAPVSLSPLPNSIPLHAEGGHMAAGETGIVGDAGPEVWRPDTAGEVIPLSKMKSEGGDVHNNTTNIHIHGVTDVDSFKQNQGEVAAQLYAAMSSAARRKG